MDGQECVWHDGEDVIFDETCVHWAENRSGSTRVILFCDLECPLRSRAMEWINHHVSNFMGAITASPNEAEEPTGAINRLFAALRHRREQSRRFKQRHRALFKAIKLAAAVMVLWVLLLAPWPLLR